MEKKKELTKATMSRLREWHADGSSSNLLPMFKVVLQKRAEEGRAIRTNDFN